MKNRVIELKMHGAVEVPSETKSKEVTSALHVDRHPSFEGTLHPEGVRIAIVKGPGTYRLVPWTNIKECTVLEEAETLPATPIGIKKASSPNAA